MTTKPDCAWNLTDLASVPKNGVKVMSTFACGGGSSMGYKRAGCEIVAANDIDPEMAWHYKRNLNPPLYYLCPIRDLLTADLPPELFALDILDGSPPCSTFNMAGSREKAWGKEKHFREGQAKQVLSDLFFDYLDLVDRLKPKVAIAENVKGMLIGNAKGYTKLVMARSVRLAIARSCSWSTRRIVACRNGASGCFSVRSGMTMRAGIGAKLFNWPKLSSADPATSLASTNHDKMTHWAECRSLTFREWKRLGSFPDDYHAKTDKIGKYMIGMSVPPKMTEVVARAVIDQWLLPDGP